MGRQALKDLSRRQFTSSAGDALAIAVLDRVATGAQPGQSAKTRLILLGTAGGPRPRKTRNPPAQVIIANGAAYVVDCGNGVAIQLVRAGVPLNSVRHVFITHHHSDHDADYGTLLLLAWASGLRGPVDTWRPPPLARMTNLFFDLNAEDIRTRTADEGRVALRPLVHPHDVTGEGIILRENSMTVKVAVVDHPPVTPAFAYRFDAQDRSIVISGDTKRSEALVRLAQGADILVHEALFASAVDRLVAPLPNAAALKRSILSHHTAVEDVGRVAQAAGVKTLVLSHFVPAEDPDITDQMWMDAARTTYNGRVVVGRDLLEI